jgi:hypothetical protein
MNRKLFALAVAAIAFAMVFTLGVRGNPQAQQIPVDRDFGAFHMWDTDQFGDDRAYSSARGTDGDADFGAHGPPIITGHSNDWYCCSDGGGG